MKTLIRGIILFLPILSFPALSFFQADFLPKQKSVRSSIHTSESISGSSSAMYHNLGLQKAGLSENAFLLAIKGFEYLKQKNLLTNTRILTICDFSKASTEKRFFVIDLESCQLLFNTLVSHGRNSGVQYAEQFSNEPSSYMSSLGFYVTRSTYSGKHGYSLHLDGLEKGINDNAYQRAIVVHGAPYVSEYVGNAQGYIGRSLGCPALPEQVAGKVIDEIKDGSCFFIYTPEKKYTSQSPVLQSADQHNSMALN